MPDQPPIRYQINARNELVFVNAAWQTFAMANGGLGLEPANILNRPLFDFITDETTRLVYHDLLQRVRAGHPVQFPFRCDSPTQRRWLDMTITLQSTGLVEFTTRMQRCEDLLPVPALERPLSSATILLRVCSWCKRVELSPQQWFNLETAVAHERLFEQPQFPQLNHGICEFCFASLQKV